MSILNRGTQTITFDFKHPAKGEDFNKLLRGLVKPGVYSGGAISDAGGNLVTIPPFNAYIQTDTDQIIHVNAEGSWNYTYVASSDQDYLYTTYTYEQQIDNFLDFAIRPTSGIAVTNELILGTINSTGGNITSVTTDGQTLGLYDADFNGQFHNDLTVENDLVVNNDMSVAQLLTANNVSVTTNLTVNGNLGIEANTSIGGNLTVSGVTTLEDNLNVDSGADCNLGGNVIINEDANIKYVRVEGANDENLIYTDASNDRIGIGTNTPAYKLDVDGDIHISDGSAFMINGEECIGNRVGGSTLRLKTVPLPAWGMVGTSSITFNHNIPSGMGKILFVKVFVWNDSISNSYDILTHNMNGTASYATVSWTDTTIFLARVTGGFFDNTNFDDNLPRGIATIVYIG